MITNLYAPIPPGRAGGNRKPRRPARRGRPLGAPARPARAEDPRRRGPRHRYRRHFPGGALTPRPAATVAPIRPARPVHAGIRRPRRRRIPRLPPRRPVLPADVDRLPRRPLLLRDRPVPHPLNESRATRHREQRPTPGLLIPAAEEQTARRGNAR